MENNLCQSCGTCTDGSKHKDYCIYCFKKGEFTNPDITKEEMTELCIPYLKNKGIEEEKANEIMNQLLPTLKLWKLRFLNFNI